MEENLLKYQTILTEITGISKKYDEIAQLTGENFNVFNILGLHSNEVRTHSAFLCELLNPKGSHGQKDTFLKLFIDLINIKYNNYIKTINTIESNAFVEYYLGYISEDGTTGGRIDILIEDKSKNAIVIENKIYAGDQDKQLIRYYNSFPNKPILYLTLNGSKPSDASFKYKEKGIELKENKDFICISYKSDIIEWLDLCRKEAVNLPIIRETITQYIHLIKLLTHQTTSNIMEKEIIELIVKNPENADSIEKSYNALMQIINEVKDRFQTLLWNDKKTHIVNIKNDLTLTYSLEYDNTGYWFGYLVKNKLQELATDAYYTNTIKEIVSKHAANVRFGSNHNWTAWFFTIDFINQKTNAELVEMYKDESKFNAFYVECKNIINQINTNIENQLK